MTDRRSRLGGAVLGALGGTALGALVPVAAAAHQLTQRYASPLPLAAYVFGAATAVALSFAFVLFRSGAAPAPRAPSRRSIEVPRWLRGLLQALGVVGWVWVVLQGITGGSEDAADAPSLILWIYGWVGLSLVSAFIGPAWRWIDPFTTIFDALTAVGGRLGLHGPEAIPYPAVLRSWPAVGGYAIFVWLELVIEGARAGRLLAGVLVLYTLWTLAMMAQYGRDTWRARGETFSVWFATVGRLAPLALPEPTVGDEPAPRSDGRLLVRRFGAGLAGSAWTTDIVVLVAIATGGILYDGLSQTAIYFDAFGSPPVVAATALLAGWLILVAGLALLVARVVGLPALGAGLLPIAVGYLVAHYLTYLLFDGQRIVALLSTTPSTRARACSASTNFEPNQLWLPAAVAWAMQLGAVVGGHVTGAWAGHRAAVEAATDEARVDGPAGDGAIDPTAPAAAGGAHGRADVADPVVPRPGDRRARVGLDSRAKSPRWRGARAQPRREAARQAGVATRRPGEASGTHSASERTSESWAAIAGSSASAAATAVSIAVRHRIPSAVAAWRISAASRTAPDWGVGVLTTSRTSPDAMSAKIDSPSAPTGAPALATGRLSNPAAARAAAVPRRRREPVAGQRQGTGQAGQLVLVAIGDREQRELARGARPRRHERGPEERLGQGHARIDGQADHLARRLHPGPERRIDAAELGRRERRRLDRDERRRRRGARRTSRAPASVAPRAIRTASSTIGTPVTLDRNGTVRDARGLTSMRYTPSSRTMNWALTRPRTPSARTTRSIELTMSSWSQALTVWGGNMPTESPEWTPARSTCSRRPGMRTSRPSLTASTSTSTPSR